MQKQMFDFIEKNLSAKRFKHSLAVADTAKKLAEKYGADPEKAYLAGIAHDSAKEFDSEEAQRKLISFGRDDVFERYSHPLIHGPLAACIIKYDFMYDDEEIFDAVWYHTTGKENMTLLTKIIYLADFIEPNREFEGIEEVRLLSEENLDKAIILAAGIVMINTVRRGLITDVDTVLARNYLLEQYKEQPIDFIV